MAKKEITKENLGLGRFRGVTLCLGKIQDGLHFHLLIDKTGEKHESLVVITLNDQPIAIYDLECAEKNFWPIIKKMTLSKDKLVATKQIN